MLTNVSFLLFFMSLILIFVQGVHFLSVLLVMELMTLSLFFMCVSFMGAGGSFSASSFALVFLVFGVYEAANGLGLLVSRTRSTGVDRLSSLFVLSF
uniref:NADH-ubiquinone oxidoreductase chain 4L n=1 Tax=Solecurtus divaricatus TaxID=444102 RepID=J3JR35_9BIVA|nr:NADH dehydrogenase subunit 4L [Solecurtus divaricatus]AEV94330.1 NADH dehydrogenase subunit 4L [Solecurtus divaricatus]